VSVESISPRVRALVDDMIETMHQEHGVGLAAQQVGVALQVMVIDVRGVADRPSSLEIGGQQVNPDDYMPVALLNPEIKAMGQPCAGQEGCLSFPELYAEITRPDPIAVTALNQNGERIQFVCGGLLARVIQHEADHLRGILFIDRMTADRKRELRPDLDKLQTETTSKLEEKARTVNSPDRDAS
jgi:peptide deformylase